MVNQATTEEIIINCAPIETRAAVLDNGVIQELYIERENHRGRVGGIFRGKVLRVLPGMQAAFVDIGFERAAFIHAKDIYVRPAVPSTQASDIPPSAAKAPETPRKTVRQPEPVPQMSSLSHTIANITANAMAPPMLGNTASHTLSNIASADASLPNALRPGEVLPEVVDESAVVPVEDQPADDQVGASPTVCREHQVPDIRELVTEGQSLVVQVAKDQIGSKGARLTTHLSIPSRYLVLMPLVNHVGVSQRIEDEEERARLRGIIEGLRSEMGDQMPGIILRTAAEDASEEALERDFNFLVKLWADIKPKLERVPPGQAILEDLPLYLRILRDMLRPQVERVRVDSKSVFGKLQAFARQFLPEYESRIEYYSGDRPLFDLYNVEEEINRALQREVTLKSGGHVVFDQTEAMTTIDVNTGAFVGSRNLEETIFKTNLEAAQAIARQMRLRNLGGILIIDFIDMLDEEHSRQVIRTFEKALEKDHVKTKITSLSELGLLEMTRKRTRESLERILCHACPVCGGRGTLKTPETICFEIYRELIREARQYNASGYLVIAAQEVVDRLLDEESANLAELAEYLGTNIRFQVESLYHLEQYDVVMT